MRYMLVVGGYLNCHIQSMVNQYFFVNLSELVAISFWLVCSYAPPHLYLLRCPPPHLGLSHDYYPSYRVQVSTGGLGSGEFLEIEESGWPNMGRLGSGEFGEIREIGWPNMGVWEVENSEKLSARTRGVQEVENWGKYEEFERMEGPGQDMDACL